MEPNTGLNPFLKIALNVFCMNKTDFFPCTLSFYILFETLPSATNNQILRNWVQSRVGSNQYHGNPKIHINVVDSIKKSLQRNVVQIWVLNY
jgi:hypothetical protein